MRNKEAEAPKTPTTRRAILFGAATVASLPLLAEANQAKAAGVTPKKNVQYREMPNGPHFCAKCNYFLPGPKADAPGQCKVVAGPINPHGWCILFAAKPA